MEPKTKKTLYRLVRLLASLGIVYGLKKYESKHGSSRALTAVSGYIGAFGAAGVVGASSVLAMNAVGLGVGLGLLVAATIVVGLLAAVILPRSERAREHVDDVFGTDFTGEVGDEDADPRREAAEHGPFEDETADDSDDESVPPPEDDDEIVVGSD